MIRGFKIGDVKRVAGREYFDLISLKCNSEKMGELARAFYLIVYGTV